MLADVMLAVGAASKEVSQNNPSDLQHFLQTLPNAEGWDAGFIFFVM